VYRPATSSDVTRLIQANLDKFADRVQALLPKDGQIDLTTQGCMPFTVLIKVRHWKNSSGIMKENGSYLESYGDRPIAIRRHCQGEEEGQAAPHTACEAK